jgi:hypothetical protein
MCNKNDKKVRVSYGLDHACGYFIQAYYNEEALVDIDTLFNTREEVISVMRKYNVPEDVVVNVILDQPI